MEKKTKLVIAKIRGVTSYGMLCSESELNLSDESDGIIELSTIKYEKKIGKSFFPKSNLNLIDLSITPNRPDCLGVKGIARDLAASCFGKFKDLKEKKIKSKKKQNLKIKINKEKGLDDKIINSYEIGYAPQGNKLEKFLLSKGD